MEQTEVTTELASIQSCQLGQMESFVLLYDRYVEKIYRFLYFRTFQKEVAEDITSETFLKAMAKIHQFNPEKGSFQVWLYQIARNLLIDESRKRRPIENLDSHNNIADSTDLEKEVQNKFKNEALQKLLQQLPDESQELITMRLWDELSYSEIAIITGKTEGSLKMQFSRIISKLQQHIDLLIYIIILQSLIFFK